MDSLRERRRLLDGDVFRRLCAAKDLAREHHAEPISLDRMARAACLSRYHFLRLFQQAFRETPHEYLTRVRIDRAKDLLARSSASVTDVCFDVGFSSIGSFSALFARRVGSPPSRFQREMRAVVQVPADLATRIVPWCFALGGFAPLASHE